MMIWHCYRIKLVRYIVENIFIIIIVVDVITNNQVKLF